MKGRPGLNPLRLTSAYQVTQSDMETLKNIGATLTSGLSRIFRPEEQIYSFKGEGRFKVGPKRGLVVEADKRDVKRMTDVTFHL